MLPAITCNSNRGALVRLKKMPIKEEGYMKSWAPLLLESSQPRKAALY